MVFFFVKKVVENFVSNKNLTIFVLQLNHLNNMNRQITEKEWELIEALRNFRNSKHNPSVQLELYIDELVDELKERD